MLHSYHSFFFFRESRRLKNPHLRAKLAECFIAFVPKEKAFSNMFSFVSKMFWILRFMNNYLANCQVWKHVVVMINESIRCFQSASLVLYIQSNFQLNATLRFVYHHLNVDSTSFSIVITPVLIIFRCGERGKNVFSIMTSI